ncbi:MAG: hypothetical protein H7Z75_21325 [Ferruginibacter sp.]|nr:hypothetical protein [Cytophagales bacterium]
MIATSTHDDIIRFVYHETSEEENVLIEQTLLAETDLQRFYEELVETKRELDGVATHSASERAVQQILVYSRNFPYGRTAH